MIICFLSFSIWLLNSYSCASETFNGRVVHVIDGDTLVVRSGLGKTRIRLWGIDAPEKDQPFSREASEFVSRMLQGKMVTVKAVERDDYGRLVAEVFLQKQDCSEAIIRSGFAWVHIFYCREKKCQAWLILEREAREARKGLWAEDKPTAPWVWKRKK